MVWFPSMCPGIILHFSFWYHDSFWLLCVRLETTITLIDLFLKLSLWQVSSLEQKALWNLQGGHTTGLQNIQIPVPFCLPQMQFCMRSCRTHPLGFMVPSSEYFVSVIYETPAWWFPVSSGQKIKAAAGKNASSWPGFLLPSLRGSGM